MRNLPSVVGGQIVSARGERWRVERIEAHAGCRALALAGVGAGNAGHRLTLVEPFDRIRTDRATQRLRLKSRDSVMRHAAAHIAAARSWHASGAGVTARMDLLSFQFAALDAVLGGATRVLIADDVGLGKTVQAGLIVAELMARGLAGRVLVLTPASLRMQWAGELSSRFALEARVFDHATINRDVASLPAGSNPWAASPVIISSIDLVKRTEVAAALANLPLDVLVVDEAHHAVPGTDRGALVADLAARATWVVLATATPHSGDPRAWTFLTDLGAIDRRDAPMTVLRRSAEEVLGRRPRREHVLRVDATDAEVSLASAVAAYCDALSRASSGSEPVRLLATVFARRAGSSAAALSRSVSRRVALLDAPSDTPPAESQPALPWDEPDGADDVEPDALLGVEGLGERAREVAMLRSIQTLAANARARSSKAELVRRCLRRLREPAVIFSEFRDTAADLRQRLDPSRQVAFIHGGMRETDRRAAVTAFTMGNADVLIATDAAGEGLNLHHRCRLVIHYEPAWSPVRVEQRAGRVDRLGQRRRVHALHLVRAGTIEADVMTRRVGRARDAASALRACTPLASAVPEAGPGVVQVELQRRALALAAHARASAPPCAAVTRARAVVLLYEVDWLDAHGGLIGHTLHPLRVALSRLPPHGSPAARRFVLALAASTPVQEVLRHLSVADAPGLAASCERTSRAWCARVEAVERAFGLRATAALQPALFDRRVEDEAERSATARELGRAHMRGRRAVIAAVARPVPSPPILVAAWRVE